MKKRKELDHQDNAPCHKSIATMAKLHEFHIQMPSHPQHCEYYLFENLEKIVARKRWSPKLKHILTGCTNHAIKKVKKCYSEAGIIVSL